MINGVGYLFQFIDDFERLVVLRLGRAQKTRGPGATVVLPCIDTYTKVDLRVNAFHVPPMQIITADHGLVELGATVYQQVKDALAAVCSVQERNHSTRILASTTLHRLVCKRSVSEISSGARRRELAAMLQDELAELTLSWGVDILKVELSDVKVIKDGENMAISALKTVMKSDFGNAILSSLGDSINEFIEEAKSNVSTDREETLPAEVGSNSESNLKMTAEVLSKRPLLTLDDLICTISMVIDESLVHQVGRVFQVDCKGLGEFFIDLKNGEGKCAIGRYSSADVVLQLDVSVFYDIIRQKVSPTQAYMNGSLHVIGPVHLAMNLSHLANRLSRLN
ncbi:hypothetical protein AB6A40_010892 [Gnathostoma spinigerum]|uniref:Band 7 domain-containing protein n=1 Tax=Gnathostoma spinigerum TaxID=75299 RepID=A0ABD6EWP0_9BILA